MKDLTSGNEARLIICFALPMLIGSLFQQFYNTVDSVVVGQALGKSALAAVGASFSIIFLLVSLIMGITMGATILIAQYFGAKDMDKVKKTISTTYLFTFYAAVAVTVTGLLCAGPILKLLKTPAEIYPMARIYLNIIFAGMIMMFGYNGVSAILRGLGDSKTPLYFLIIATVLNIILDLVFVLAFKWGVAGAAWATVTAQGVSFILSLCYLDRTHEIFKFRWKDLYFDRKIFNLSLKIGLPTGIQQTLVAAGFMALLRIVNGFGTDTVAAYSAGSRLDSFAALPIMNISMAVSSFVGQNLGAKRPDRVQRGYLAAFAISGGISLFTTIAVILFARPLIAVFNRDPNVVRLGADYLIIVGAFYIVFAGMFVNSGVLRGAGDTLIPMFITMLSLWLIRIPVSAFLSAKMGPSGIWWGIPIGWIAGFIMSTLYYLKGNWKKKTISSHIEEEGDYVV
ncbi:MAG: MATE family efflux transporter [Bacillota bacterium]